MEYSEHETDDTDSEQKALSSTLKEQSTPVLKSRHMRGRDWNNVSSTGDEVSFRNVENSPMYYPGEMLASSPFAPIAALAAHSESDDSLMITPPHSPISSTISRAYSVALSEGEFNTTIPDSSPLVQPTVQIIPQEQRARANSLPHAASRTLLPQQPSPSKDELEENTNNANANPIATIEEHVIPPIIIATYPTDVRNSFLSDKLDQPDPSTFTLSSATSDAGDAHAYSSGDPAMSQRRDSEQHRATETDTLCRTNLSYMHSLPSGIDNVHSPASNDTHYLTMQPIRKKQTLPSLMQALQTPISSLTLNTTDTGVGCSDAGFLTPRICPTPAETLGSVKSLPNRDTIALSALSTTVTPVSTQPLVHHPSDATVISPEAVTTAYASEPKKKKASAGSSVGFGGALKLKNWISSLVSDVVKTTINEQQSPVVRAPEQVVSGVAPPSQLSPKVTDSKSIPSMFVAAPAPTVSSVTTVINMLNAILVPLPTPPAQTASQPVIRTSLDLFCEPSPVKFAMNAQPSHKAMLQSMYPHESHMVRSTQEAFVQVMVPQLLPAQMTNFTLDSCYQAFTQGSKPRMEDSSLFGATSCGKLTIGVVADGHGGLNGALCSQTCIQALSDWLLKIDSNACLITPQQSKIASSLKNINGIVGALQSKNQTVNSTDWTSWSPETMVYEMKHQFTNIQKSTTQVQSSDITEMNKETNIYPHDGLKLQLQETVNARIVAADKGQKQQRELVTTELVDLQKVHSALGEAFDSGPLLMEHETRVFGEYSHPAGEVLPCSPNRFVDESGVQRDSSQNNKPLHGGSTLTVVLQMLPKHRTSSQHQCLFACNAAVERLVSLCAYQFQYPKAHASMQDMFSRFEPQMTQLYPLLNDAVSGLTSSLAQWQHPTLPALLEALKEQHLAKIQDAIQCILHAGSVPGMLVVQALQLYTVMTHPAMLTTCYSPHPQPALNCYTQPFLHHLVRPLSTAEGVICECAAAKEDTLQWCFNVGDSDALFTSYGTECPADAPAPSLPESQAIAAQVQYRAKLPLVASEMPNSEETLSFLSSQRYITAWNKVLQSPSYTPVQLPAEYNYLLNALRVHHSMHSCPLIKPLPRYSCYSKARLTYLNVHHGPSSSHEYERQQSLHAETGRPVQIPRFEERSKQLDEYRPIFTNGKANSDMIKSPTSYGLTKSNIRGEPPMYFVHVDPEVPSQNVSIAMSRSIGDCHARRYGQISEPSWTFSRVPPLVHFSVFVGSDGVWDCWMQKRFGQTSISTAGPFTSSVAMSDLTTAIGKAKTTMQSLVRSLSLSCENISRAKSVATDEEESRSLQQEDEIAFTYGSSLMQPHSELTYVPTSHSGSLRHPIYAQCNASRRIDHPTACAGTGTQQDVSMLHLCLENLFRTTMLTASTRFNDGYDDTTLIGWHSHSKIDNAITEETPPSYSA